MHHPKNILKFKFIIIMMTMTSLISNNYMFTWIIIEITTLLFIFMLIMTDSNKYISIIYFMISFMTSSLMLISLISINKYLDHLLLLNLLIKMSVFPFNGWFNYISNIMTINNLFIMMTFVKLPLFQLLSLSMTMNILLLSILIMNLLIVPILILNKNSLKLMLSYSSIYQTSIMILIMFNSFNLFLAYYALYVIATFSIINNVVLLNYNSNPNSMLTLKQTWYMLFINILLYSYLPPMISFGMKWSILEFLILNNKFITFITAFLIFTSSIIMAWIYFNFITGKMLKYSYQKMVPLKNIYMKWTMYITNSAILFLTINYLYFNII